MDGIELKIVQVKEFAKQKPSLLLYMTCRERRGYLRAIYIMSAYPSRSVVASAAAAFGRSFGRLDLTRRGLFCSRLSQDPTTPLIRLTTVTAVRPRPTSKTTTTDPRRTEGRPRRDTSGRPGGGCPRSSSSGATDERAPGGRTISAQGIPAEYSTVC